MPRTIVFSGPTLHHAEVASVLDAICRPPAAQGDIVQAVLRYAPDVIVLIDGVFQSRPAVRHAELLWAMSRGIAVAGAASMGALRAAELYPRMRGVGLIYRWYRRHALAPDDAVAVLHGPAGVDFAPLTESAFDLRMTIRRAWRRGAIDKNLRIALERAVLGLNFRQRTLENAMRRVLGDDAAVRAFMRRLQPHAVQQKRQDALCALRQVSDGVIEMPAPCRFTVTAAFQKSLEDAGISLP